MKKLILTLFLVIFLTSSVLATDVAYVVKSGADSVLTSELNYAGLTYNVISDSNIPSTNFSKYKIILVGEGNFDNFESIPVAEYNSLIMNSYHFYQKGIFIISDSQWGWSANKGSASSPTNLKFNTLNTTIINNLPETFKAYTISDIDLHTYYLTGKKATGTKLIVRVDGHTSSDAVIGLAYPGTKYLNGEIGQARSLFFGIVTPEYWTTGSRQLFRNSLNWILIGEDNDKDGFYTEEDCDDTNAEINPDAEDIAYDGIDQDCNGYDLADVDEDGYCKEGYAMQNASLQCSSQTGLLGTDCDDDYFEMNPGSSDLSLNCINDAPVISSIPNFFIKESQTITVLIPASDPEDDNLTYSINSSKFTQLNTNTFRWQTGFYDAGNYVFMANVSDGQFNTTKTFKVNISDKNQPPVLNTTIPDQIWDEDTNFSLNLSKYFYEADPEDNLTFGISDTSSSMDIVIESIIGGIVNFVVKPDWNGWDWIVFFVNDGEVSVESNHVVLTVSPVNDAPVLLTSIPSETWNEDSSLTLNLSKYFKDIDSKLNYSAMGNSQVNVNFTGNMATFTPVKDWNGEETIKINASDGEFYILSNEFILEVSPVNDAPVLDFINDELLLAGGLVDIDSTATDIDGDSLNFTFSLPLNQAGQWQTSEQDAGNYKITASVHDGNGGSDSQQFNVQILQKFYINEFVPNPTNGSEWIELYNEFNQVINLSNCLVKDGADNIFNLNGTLGQKGFATVEISNKLNNLGDILKLYCSGKLIDTVTYGDWDDGNLSDNAEAPSIGESASRDPDGLDTGNNFEDFKIFEHPTKGLSSDTDMVAPVVELSNPLDNALFNVTRAVTFEFIATDNMAQTLGCDVYLDGNFKATDKTIKNNTIENITVNDIPDGVYSWTIKCYDSRNYAFAPTSRTLNISAPDSPVLNSIAKKYVNENENLEFTISGSDPDFDSIYFSMQNPPEGANLVDNLNGTAVFSWTPTYEQAGEYEITFIVEDSTGLWNQAKGMISVKNQRIPPKFEDIDRCDVKNSSLEITISDPDSGDNFEVGETINVKTKIRNNYSEELDVDVKAYLYDISEEEVVEDAKENGLNIDKGKSKNAEFELKIPEDAEENEFAVFVLAEGENGEVLCNEQFVYVDVERKEHELIINNVLMSQESVLPGNNFEVTVEMQNMGSEDEDVRVEIKNSGLGILSKSEEFELESYGDDDEETVTLTIQMPQNAIEGNYTLGIKVISSDTEDSETGVIYVLKQEEITGNGIIYMQEGKTEAVKQNGGLAYITLGLFFLLILGVIFIIIIAFYKE